MAQTILKEFTYDGSKVVVEVARRDAQGRTIDTTYATIAALAEKLDASTFQTYINKTAPAEYVAQDNFKTDWLDTNNVAYKSDIPDTSDFITVDVNNLTNYYTKFQTYTKTEVDNIVNTIKTGAIFTGDVTFAGNLAAAAVKTASLTSDKAEISAQKPVVEVMNGYSITPAAENINLLYAGAAKNGNKLSFAFFGTYSYKSGDVIIPFANIGIPADVGDKIVPYELSGENRMIYSGVASLFSSRTAYKSCIVEMQKLTNSLLRIIFVNLNSSDLVDGTTYYFRFEITFLLSDNLVA